MLTAENSGYETVVFDDGPGSLRAHNQDVLVDCQLNLDVLQGARGWNRAPLVALLTLFVG